MIEPAVHDWFKQATLYAKQHGIGIALEFDPRHSIPVFKQRYPDDMQERLWLTEIDLAGNGPDRRRPDATTTATTCDAICPSAPAGVRLERVYSLCSQWWGRSKREACRISPPAALLTRRDVATAMALTVSLPSADGLKACVIDPSHPRLPGDLLAASHRISRQRPCASTPICRWPGR